MSEELAQQTLGGIYEFCNQFIEKEDVKEKILNHLNNIFKNWPDSWNAIKEWMYQNEFQNKEQVLLNFIEKIPELQIFQSIILTLINHHSSFWDCVYENLCECKSLLNR